MHTAWMKLTFALGLSLSGVTSTATPAQAAPACSSATVTIADVLQVVYCVLYDDCGNLFSGCELPASSATYEAGFLAGKNAAFQEVLDCQSTGGTWVNNACDGATGAPGDIDRCTAIEQSIIDAGFEAKVGVRCEEDYAYLVADTYPDHDLMNGIIGTNEQVPAPDPDFEVPIPLEPTMATSVTTRDAALAIAVNGVPIYDYTAGGEIQMDAAGNAPYDSNLDTLLLGQLDHCGGHAGRGDDYHYHKAPHCMIAMMANKDDNPIIGWAYDGYPVYGYNNPDGSPVDAGALDPCNGIEDDTYGYRYQATETQPYITKCLRGVVDETMLKPVSTTRPGGKPLDASGLSYAATPHADGTETRRLEYTYQALNYYIEYTTRSDTARCFDFDSYLCNRSGNGDCDATQQTGCYCRPMPPGEQAPAGCQ